MSKKPCIRDLSYFKKKGCPEKEWNGEIGCPAWATLKDKNQRVINEGCIDTLNFFINFEALKCLEGNQHATESLRNGMVETDNQGNTRPKMDIGTTLMMNLAIEHKKSLEQ